MSCGWTSLSAMRESIHAKVVLRAAQIRGGAVALSQALGVPLSEVQAWMRSETSIPEQVFVGLLDMIVEEAWRSLTNDRPSDDGGQATLISARKVSSAAHPSVPSARSVRGGRGGL